MKDKYIIIDKTVIQKRIEELEKIGSEQAWGAKIAFKEILFQSTPLIPEIERAFDAGSERGEHGYGNANDKQDYISNLKLDI